MGKSQALIASMSPTQLDPIALAHHVIAPGWKPDGIADEPFWSHAATLYLLPVDIDATPRNSPPVRVAWTDDFLLLSCGRANEPTADGKPVPPSQIRFFFGLPSTDSVENTLTDGTRIKGAAPIYVVSVNSNGNAGDWTDNVSANAPKWKSNAITAVRSDANGWQAEVAIPWSSLTPPKSGKPIAFNITSSLTSSDPKAEVWSPWLRGKNAPSFWSSFFGALQLQSGPAKE